MNFRMLSKLTGYILFIEAAAMTPALGFSMIYGERTAIRGFLTAMLLSVIVGALCMLPKPRIKQLYVAEGFAVTVISWILMAFFGSLPFLFSGVITNPIDCFFETMSGFTTTGASILPEVESLPRGILFWRCFTHWIGGMGVLVFLLALLPNSGGKGYSLHLLRAESPGPDVGKLTPKLRRSAMILYIIYIVLTIVQMIFLLCGGMPVFDSICTAVATAGTGGFGIKNASLAGYSPYLQMVTAVFMMLFGINFSIFYFILIREVKAILHDEELWLYLALVVVSTTVILLDILPLYQNVSQAFRDAFFQVTAVMSTTGFATTDFDKWPDFSRGVLLLLMMIGGSAGSTAGGFKVSRVLILIKSLRQEISRTLHPGAVRIVRLRGRPIEKTVQSTVGVYTTAYFGLIVLSFILVLLDNKGLFTSLSAVITCFNNVGPGFDLVGPTKNFSIFSGFNKLVLSLDMLLGRLEIFPVLAILSPSIWKKSLSNLREGED